MFNDDVPTTEAFLAPKQQQPAQENPLVKQWQKLGGVHKFMIVGGSLWLGYNWLFTTPEAPVIVSNEGETTEEVVEEESPVLPDATGATLAGMLEKQEISLNVALEHQLQTLIAARVMALHDAVKVEAKRSKREVLDVVQGSIQGRLKEYEQGKTPTTALNALVDMIALQVLEAQLYPTSLQTSAHRDTIERFQGYVDGLDPTAQTTIAPATIELALDNITHAKNLVDSQSPEAIARLQVTANEAK